MQPGTYAAAGSVIIPRHSPRAHRARKMSKNEPKCKIWSVYATTHIRDKSMTGINASENKCAAAPGRTSGTWLQPRGGGAEKSAARRSPRSPWRRRAPPRPPPTQRRPWDRPQSDLRATNGLGTLAANAAALSYDLTPRRPFRAAAGQPSPSVSTL